MNYLNHCYLNLNHYLNINQKNLHKIKQIKKILKRKILRKNEE